jgi:hypothetical protein
MSLDSSDWAESRKSAIIADFSHLSLSELWAKRRHCSLASIY